MDGADRPKKASPEGKQPRRNRTSGQGKAHDSYSHGHARLHESQLNTGPVKTLDTLQPHDHLCLIYESKEEWRDVIIPFLTIGLNRGEKCIYVVDSSTADEIRGYLGEEGIDVTAAEETGHLVILQETAAYIREGSFDPDAMIALLQSETQKAIAEGYPALRVTGEMTWVLRGYPGSEKMLEYEAKLNRDLIPNYPCLVICQYDRWRFDPEIIKGVIVTHPLLVRGHTIYHNFYYIPPADLLTQKRAELEAQLWLNNIAREQKIWDELAVSRRKYAGLVESLNSGIAVYEAVDNGEDFVFVDFNRAGERIDNISRDEVIGRSVLEVFPSVREFDLFEVFQRVWRTGKPEHHPVALYQDDRISGWRENYVYRLASGEVVAIYEDITERKQAEQALWESEEFNSGLLERSPNPMLVINPDLSIRYVNPALERLTGFSADELVDCKPPYPYWHEEDPSIGIRMKRMVTSIQTGRTSRREVRFMKKSREDFWIELNALTVEQDGKPKYHLANWVDITERKQAEQALRESEAFNSNILQNAPNPLLVMNPDTTVNYVNPSFEKFTGFTAEEVIGFKAPHPWWPEQVNSENMSRLQVRTDNINAEVELELQKKSGERFWVNTNLAVIEEDGQLAYTLINWVDITERKQAEQALRESEEFRFGLLQNSPNPIVVFNPDLTIRYVNPAVELITGFSADELIGCSQPYPYWHEEDKGVFTRRMNGSVRSAGGLSRFESRFINKSGESFWVELTTVTIEQDGAARYHLSNWVDITERKRAEEALKRVQEFRNGLLDNSPNPILVFNTDSSVHYVNPAMEKLTGFGAAELMGKKPPYPWWPEKDWPGLLERIKKSIDRGGVAASQNHFVKKNGEDFWVEVTGVTVRKDREIAYHLSNWVDITERKQAEKALEESEENFHNSMDNSPLGIRIITDEGELLYANRAILDIYGYDNIEELKSKPAEQCYTAQGYSDYLERKKERKADRPVTPGYEISILRKDGEVRQLAATRKEVVWNGEKRFQVLYEDITERKQTEAALRESEEKYRGLVEALQQGVWVIDAAAHTTFVNRPMADILGYTREEMSGKPPSEFMDVAHARITERALARRRQGERETHDFEFIKKDGSKVCTTVITAPLKDDRGTYAGAVAGIIDVTERRQAESALRESEEKLRLILETIPVGLTVADMAGRIVQVNRAKLRMHGYDREEEIIGMSVFDFTPERERPEDIDGFRRRIKKEKVIMREQHMLRKDGSEFPAVLNLVLLEDAAGQPLGSVATTVDITEVREAEKARQQMEEYRELDRLKTNILATVSHELRTPLAAIRGYTTLMLEYERQLEVAQKRESLRAIDLATGRLTELIDHLLDMSRLDAGLMQLNLAPTRLKRIISTAVAEARLRSPDWRFELDWQRVPAVMMVDASRVRQVIDNLLDNAVKYSVKGKTVNVRGRREAGETVISVSDQGVSVPESEQENIFNRMYRLEERLSEDPGGLGLGLAICKSLVEAHGGRIWVESDPGIGSTFHFTLPIRDQARG
ncbi:PAS domain S-box protein [Chloroflexota bacterium]